VKFLLDESADFGLAGFLRELGHDVTTIIEDHPRALADSEVLALASQEQRILITNDRDFGELVFRRRLPHTGVILLRLQNEALSVKQEKLSLTLERYADQLTHFVVITDRAVRIRRARKL